MAQLLHFPQPPRVVLSTAQLALVEAMDIIGDFRGGSLSSKDALARLMSLPEVARRLGRPNAPLGAIGNAGEALDHVAAVLDDHYVEGGSAEDACRRLLALSDELPVIEICETVLARRSAVREAGRWH